jgi:hypothetical protein
LIAAVQSQSFAKFIRQWYIVYKISLIL